VVEAVVGAAGCAGVGWRPGWHSAPRRSAADSLLISGGHCPTTALASQLGARRKWQQSIAAFTPQLAPGVGRVAGAARGVFGLAAAVRDGEAAADAIAAELGHANLAAGLGLAAACRTIRSHTDRGAVGGTRRAARRSSTCRTT
jgi:hypothetical protein